jgi:hypothetical protein
MLSFDIETQPLPDVDLLPMVPEFDASEFQPSEFDPASVKYGNLKDPEKRRLKLEEARLNHEKRQAGLAHEERAARAEHIDKFRCEATLYAAYSRLCVVGWFSDRAGFDHYADDNEQKLLTEVWSTLAKATAKDIVIGINIFDFDLPYLINRTWINGLTVPPEIVHDLNSKWPKYHHRLIDLRRRWLAGRSPYGTKSSFDMLGDAFDGSRGKDIEGCDGGTFWQVWRDDRETALKYLENDVRKPIEWAQRMGVTA